MTDFLTDKKGLTKYKGRDKIVQIPEGIETINPYAFSNNITMEEIIFPCTLKEIKHDAFYGCKNLKKIEIPDGVEKIGDTAFALCLSLESVKLPGNLREIPSRCFYGCNNLCSISIPQSVSRIGRFALSRTGIESIVIPEGITAIEENVFSNCNNLNEIRLPGSLKTVDKNAFLGCRFETVSIPESVRDINDGAFYGCKNLSSINFNGSIPVFIGCPFSYCDKLCDEKGMLIIDNKLFYTIVKNRLVIDGCTEDRQAICNAHTIVFPKEQKTINTDVYANAREITMYDTTEFTSNEQKNYESEFYGREVEFFKNITITCLSSDDRHILYKLRIDTGNEFAVLDEQIMNFTQGNFSEKLHLFDNLFTNMKDIKAKADIAFDRLEYDYNLSDAGKRKYQAFIKENAEKICFAYLKSGDDIGIYKLVESVCFSENSIQKFIDYTSLNGNEILSAFFLNYAHSKFSESQTNNEDFL